MLISTVIAWSESTVLSSKFSGMKGGGGGKIYYVIPQASDHRYILMFKTCTIIAFITRSSDIKLQIFLYSEYWELCEFTLKILYFRLSAQILSLTAIPIGPGIFNSGCCYSNYSLLRP